MSEKRSYYEVLGISQDADQGEVKKAFKRIAMESHPDRNRDNPEAEKRFKAAAEAYEVLSDPEKRQLYDRYGSEGPRQAGFEGFGGMGMDDVLSHLSDLFGGSFGFGFGGGGRQRVERGEDLQIEVAISFLEAARGCQKPVTLRRPVACTPCSGTGAKAGTQPTTCSQCGGRGQVITRQGFLTVGTDCPTCRGRGQVIKDKCGECKGAGLVRVEETLSVSVPAGIDDGQTLRVPGKGAAAPRGGQPGHLYVTFHVEADPRFAREGDHLLTEVQLSFAQAALGTRLPVPTLDGDHELEVEPGTQPGAIVVLKGRGVRNVHGRGTGDLVVRFKVAVPKKLSAEQRHLIEELARLEPEAPVVGLPAEPEAEEHESEGFSFFRRKKKKG